MAQLSDKAIIYIICTVHHTRGLLSMICCLFWNYKIEGHKRIYCDIEILTVQRY